jgi:hypothetical protein
MKTITNICILILVIGCSINSPLPDEYIICTHVGGKTFKYERENSTKHILTDCPQTIKLPDGKCPIIYEIEDLNGETRHYNHLEMKNWNCLEVTDK